MTYFALFTNTYRFVAMFYVHSERFLNRLWFVSRTRMHIIEQGATHLEATSRGTRIFPAVSPEKKIQALTQPWVG